MAFYTGFEPDAVGFSEVFFKIYAFKIWRVRKYLYLCSPVSGMAP